MPVPAALTTADLAAALRRPTALAAERLDAGWLDAAAAHGVLPLLVHALESHGLLERTPPALAASLRRARRDAIVLDALAQHESARVIRQLGAAGVDAVIFKGAALAHTHYAASWLRPHGDIDLLVREGAQADVSARLEAIGYRRADRPEGQHVTHQARFLAPTGDFACDVHWRVADPEAFADCVAFEPLWQRAERPVIAGGRTDPAGGDRVRRAHPLDALLIACLHRVAHHHDSDRLLLLYDIDRLARGLAPADWSAWLDMVAAVRLRTICDRGLSLARDHFDTPVPPAVFAALRAGAPDAGASYVTGEVRRVDVLRSDLQHLAGWRNRLRLLREHLLPPPSYVAARYGHPPAALLPLCYLHRVAAGAPAWFRPLATNPCTPIGQSRPQEHS